MFSNTCPGIAQGNATIQHGVQHLMAQFHLCRTLHHPVSREQVPEDMVDILVRVFPVVIFSIIQILISFVWLLIVSPHLQLAPR